LAARNLQSERTRFAASIIVCGKTLERETFITKRNRNFKKIKNKESGRSSFPKSWRALFAASLVSVFGHLRSERFFANQVLLGTGSMRYANRAVGDGVPWSPYENSLDGRDQASRRSMMRMRAR
jgi:hypothetical protein